jgi:preprotein translocase subunit Sss1
MKWALWTSVAVGAAAGMVLSAAVGVVIIPLMVLLRHETPGRRLGVNVLGLLIVIGIYFLTNPYVAVHLIQHDSTGVLASNFGNSRAMYPKAFDLVNAAKLLAVGASPPLLVFGTIGFLILLIKDRRISALGWLLGVPALLILIEFVNHAGNKPGEYARFALFADVALMLAAVLAVGRLTSKTSGRVILGIVLFLPTLLYSHVYDAAFLRDSFPDTSRQEVAEQLSDTLDSQKMTDLLAAGKRPALGMYAEPAPYCMPPMDLFRWKIVLLPPGNTDADVIVQPDQTLDVLNPMSTPMTWANEHFDVNMK